MIHPPRCGPFDTASLDLVKMLGRLLHTAASSLGQSTSSTRSHASLHSVTEEAHTHNLLFPDASLLQHSQNYAYPLHNGASPTTATAARSFDDQGEWDVQSSQDLRVIIAQDAMGSLDQSIVLFDSKPPPARPPPPKPVVDPTAVENIGSDGRPATTQSATAARGSATPPPGSQRHGAQRNSISLRSPLGLRNAQATEAPAHTGSKDPEGAILRSSLRGKPTWSAVNDYESIQSRLASEAEDEQRSLVNCMFGVTVFSYKGPSTKLHILPSDSASDVSNTITHPMLDRGCGPFGRMDGSKRGQPIRAGATTSFRNDGRRPSSSASNGSNKTKEKTTILITRMFSVNLPQTKSPSEAPHDHDSNGEKSSGEKTSGANGYPFPEVPGCGVPKSKKAKQIKTPMYGVSIVLQLPQIHRGMLAPSSRSENRSAWQSFESDAFTSIGGIPSEVDGRLDHIVRHWDVITRTLAYLQSIASERILNLLKTERDVTPPLSAPMIEPEPVAPGTDSKPPKKFKLPGTNQWSLRLQANALMGNEHIQKEAKLVVVRIALGLRIPRVVTGQGRWGVWREEARWVGRWAGGKEQNFFFFNLLTAFLGNHTGWLNSLGPSWYKRRHFQQQLAHQSEPVAIPSRTVIVASDKMAARRLIFLLSAFLAAKHLPFGASSPQRPETSSSHRSYSQSPPSGIPLLRQESLRRTINKRGRGNRPGDLRSHKRVTSFPSRDTTMGRGLEVDPLSPHSGQHLRRQSDSRSINVTNIPVHSNGTPTRKNSNATTATATPNKTVPIPHFTRHGNEEQRPTSSESVASVTLRQTLNRSEGTNVSNNSADSQSASRWGSLISGFWSIRRESSTDESDFLALSQEGLGISGIHGSNDIVGQSPYKSKVTRMADEANRIRDNGDLFPEDLEDRSIQSLSTVQPSPEHGRDSSSRVSSSDSSPTAAKAIPERPKLCESPLKMSVDENDGVVNIDLPMPRALSSSFGSHMSSPGKTQHTPCSSLDGHASGASPSRAEPESAANVAGWLRRYHEDFTLQAVRPYADLVQDIKRSMRAEPTPNTTSTTPNGEGGPVEKWVDVCTTLVADTTTFSITRLRLRRRIRLNPVPATSAHAEAQPSTPIHSQYGHGHPYTADQLTPGFSVSDDLDHLEEEMAEEAIMDMDGTLIDAVERVLVQSGQSSKAHSTASSRSGSTRAGRREKSGGAVDSLPTLEVPRGECKRMVLGALEQVVKSVTADRSLEESGGRGRDIRGRGGTSRSASTRSVPVESTLREGIRKWLHEVEDA